MSKMIVPLTYKILGDGVQRSDGASIPNSIGNRDWRAYLLWLDEGNTPEPQFTPEEIAQKPIDDEIRQHRADLKKVVTGQFEMVLELFKLIKQFTDCTNADVDPDLLAKAQDWTQKLARLKELS